LKTGDLNNCKPMMWRFEAIDDPDVEIMMSRDTDTRILLREKLAVHEWLKSGKIFHIMRDHPCHDYYIQAGMFGTKKINQISSWKDLILTRVQNGSRICDQDFLTDIIYPVIKNDSLKHCSYNQYENDCINFPINYCNEYKFVGEYVYSDDSRSINHINILKDSFKINLITYFYEKSVEKNNELIYCLKKNIECNYISNIYLFVDNIQSLNKVIEMNENNKIKIINVGKQPLYSEMFQYCIDNLNDKICMISNSDVYLYKCDIKLLDKLNDNIFTISSCIVNEMDNHDAFIFNPKYIKKNILKNLEYCQNSEYSYENKLSHDYSESFPFISVKNNFLHNGYKLYDPYYQIMIINMNKKCLKKKIFLENTENTDLDNYTFFKGLDYSGNDIMYKNNILLNELKNICDNDDNIVGFNTLGFIKNNININDLKETNWINNNNKHGIYIKNKYLDLKK
jgi:hypothetical protein